MDIVATGSLTFAFLVQFGAVIWWGSKLTQKVSDLAKISHTPPCPFTTSMREEVIRMEERENLANKIAAAVAIAVASAKKEWELKPACKEE
jgi:hypothetical protein